MVNTDYDKCNCVLNWLKILFLLFCFIICDFQPFFLLNNIDRNIKRLKCLSKKCQTNSNLSHYKDGNAFKMEEGLDTSLQVLWCKLLVFEDVVNHQIVQLVVVVILITALSKVLHQQLLILCLYCCGEL